MTRRWPKVFAIGDRYTEGLWDGEVSITEKVDGSQLNVSLSSRDGLTFLTKGSVATLGDNNKLFHPAVSYFHSIESKLTPDWTYHGETLANPRHNTLAYDRVPKNHFALYGVSKPDGSQISTHAELTAIAQELGVDVVPEIFKGKVEGDLYAFLEGLLNRESYLGKESAEGIVAKRYDREVFVGNQLIPLMQGKLVCAKFKERHKVAWPTNNKSPLLIIGSIVRTEARWMKAIQYLKDTNQCEQHPRDIGKILKRLHEDLEEEDKEHIKDRLWDAFGKDIKRAATRGLPEAYKMYLATGELKMDQKIEELKEEGVQ